MFLLLLGATFCKEENRAREDSQGWGWEKRWRPGAIWYCILSESGSRVMPVEKVTSVCGCVCVCFFRFKQNTISRCLLRIECPLSWFCIVSSQTSFHLKKFFLLIYVLLWGIWGLGCCAPAFSSGSKWGLFFVVVLGFLIVVASHCRAWALVHQLRGCGASAQLYWGLWNLPQSGIKPTSLARAGGFLTTGPPGRSQTSFQYRWASLCDIWDPDYYAGE